MKNKSKDIKIIERYLREKMGKEERKAFENRIEKDSILAEEFNLTKVIMANLKQQGDEELRDQISQVHQKMKAEGVVKPYPKFRTIKRVMLAAAAVLLLGVLFADLFSEGNNPNQDKLQLFRAFFEPDTEAITPIRDELLAMGLAASNREKNKALATALALYEQADYAAAGVAIKEFKQQNPEEPIAQYYHALLKIQQEKFVEGIDQLELLLRSSWDISISKEKIQWYLALAYLGSGSTDQMDRAETLLMELEIGNSDLGKKARTLLMEWK